MSISRLQGMAAIRQAVAVSETMESARRWSGFVCPDCRFVFRVPRDHDGKGIVCPSCRRILRIPAPGDTPPALIVPLRRVSAAMANDVSQPQATKRRRRGKKVDPSENLEWESQNRNIRRGEKQQMRMMMIGGGGLFVMLVLGVIVAQHGKSNGRPPGPGGVSKQVLSSPKAAPPAAAQRSEVALASEAEVLARKFLLATRVEEILPLVRNPGRAEPRMRQYYPDGKIAALGLSQFNSSGSPYTRGLTTSFSVTTRDQEEKAIAFFDGPQGLKIDWESWVGWSEMPWQKFLSEKPATGHVFRVTLAAIDYYNFDFKDDGKWQSFRLESPDQEYSIYGYVEKGSLLDKQIQPAGDAKVVPLMVSLKFPERGTSPNQVLIERLVGEGWVEDDPKP
ncbi:MAG: hypothetical protein ABI600_21365 [Luteolibacter sp.]